MIFSKNKSLVCFNPLPAAKLRLVCFPCAGGGASMYRRWAQLLPEVEVWAVNYPGRETLHSLPYAGSVADIVTLIVESTAFWHEKPFALYGHSFGALVAFSAACRLQTVGVQALGVMVSARRAPQLPASETYGNLSNDQFLAQLDRFGGVPAAIRNDPDMMAFYMPVIRADLHLNDITQTSASDVINVPLYVFSARFDQVATEQELQAWQHCTRAAMVRRTFDGGHFFIQDDAEGFTASLRTILHTLQQQNDEELIAF